MILTVPHDLTLYPSLGGQVCDFIEQNLVYGPGDLRGQPVVLDEEKRALIWRMYEVYPKGHPNAGRRRFRRCAVSLPKGTGKTELAAWLTACELHSEAPVRCTGFSRGGEPLGGPVTDPYIPMVAFSEEQSAELAFAALRVVLENSPLRDDFDIGLERVMRKKGDGKALSLSTNPNARDGARTTFSVQDETHRWYMARHRQTYQVMSANIVKRYLADAWMLDTTTAPEPGNGSIAETTMEHARGIESGKDSDPTLFFFHRQASDHHDLTTVEGLKAAVIEASGPAAAWRDIDGIVGLFGDPAQDRTYLERVYTNRLVKSTTQAFDVTRWDELKRDESPVKKGDMITLGFDGALFHDSIALVGTHVKTGYQWKVGLWERPYGVETWQAPAEDISGVVDAMFSQYTVWRMYCDPPYWESWVSLWVGKYGKEHVIEWWTNRRTQMSAALRSFVTAMREGSITHDGDPDVRRHIGNSRREDLKGWVDDLGQPLWLIRKERPDSPLKIDAAMASCLSWEARNDAVASGATAPAAAPALVILGSRRR